MKSILKVVCVFLATGAASASSVDDSYVLESLPGCYTQASSSDPIHTDYSYDAVLLERSLSGNSISVRLTRSSTILPIQTYICDSKEHAGDGDNTGDTYIARCDQNAIEIRRVFKQLKFPLIVNYSRTDNGLEMVETFDGSSFKRHCSFIPINRRYFLCDAEDRIGRKSFLKVYADSKIIEQKGVSGSETKWNRLYDDTKACGLNASNAQCYKRVVSNLGDANKSYDAAYGSVRCERANGQPILELNANFEINRSGDGNGTFTCGPLPRNDLVLSNCKAIVN